MIRRFGAYLFFLSLSALAASTGMLFSPGVWYQNLAKPPFTPPNIVFPIAWTVLYIVMAIAVARVWNVETDDVALKKSALRLYIMQLVFNALWSWIFFGRHQMLIGLFDIGALWGTLAFCTVRFYRLDRVAGVLMLPYLIWVSFAMVLNLFLVILN